MGSKMRTQITAYLSEETKVWLQRYARGLGLKESEVVRLLIERERRIQWLSWSLDQPDPDQHIAATPLDNTK